jgi:hypothetical protein
MKATPIARYLDQKGRTEPVAWPPTRQDAFPFKPKQAQRGQETPTSIASEFRRATLSDAIQSRARDASDRQSGAQAETDTRRRDSIFSRPREAAPAPAPEPAPDPDIESQLAEAYHRGVQAGMDAANGEAATARALERAETQRRSVVERLDFQMNELAQLGETISSGLREVENRIADVVARILQPLVTQAVSRKVVDELIENITRLLRNGGQTGLMKISGPEKILNVLKKRVSQIAVDVEYVSEDEGIEVTVEAQHTTIRSAFAPWADLIASLDEPG